MSDIFSQLAQPADTDAKDPMVAAKGTMKPALIKRFYRKVGAVSCEGGYELQLDDRPVKTPARRTLTVPTQAAADLLVAEWDGQGEQIDPAAMPMTRLANAAIDGVADRRTDTAEQIAAYLESDLICYRASDPAALCLRQSEHWDPIHRWLNQALHISLQITEGIMPVAQPAENADRCVALLDGEGHFELAALHSVTNLCGSAAIALALRLGEIDPDQGWRAAHVDEDWNIGLWGEDDEAVERRRKRRTEYDVACIVLGRRVEGAGN